MRNRQSTDIIAVLIAAAALGTVFFSARGFAPRVDRQLHAAIGKALANEALSLLGPGGKITVISRDTEAFPQPAIDILLESFQREVRRAGASLAASHAIQSDPLRPIEVPPGDFYELIRRLPAEHVIVSFLGPPLLTEEQRAKLGRTKPKIVAFCSGNLAEIVDLRQLFEAGLLQVAVVSQRAGPGAAERSPSPSKTFDQLYQIVKAGDLSTLLPPAAAAR